MARTVEILCPDHLRLRAPSFAMAQAVKDSHSTDDDADLDTNRGLKGTKTQEFLTDRKVG